MLYIIIAVLVFGILVATHELGHFLSAKLLGVKVNEFAVGMGPALLKWGKGETLYSLRALPIGGFCAMEGEDDDSADPRSFGRASWWRKIIILCAGAAMNFLTGLAVLLVLNSQSPGFAMPAVAGFMEGYGLEECGLLFQETNTKPEIEAFDPGMIANAAYYLKKGIIKAPLHFQFCMGCANGIVGTMKNLVFMKETMESLCPGSTWSCFGVGHSAMEMMYGAVAMGGHIRVGMEDNVMYSKGVLADSNAQFVERARRVIEEFGREVATPDEARQILGLK